MVEVRPFHPDDIDALALQDHQLGEMARLGDWRATAREAGAAGPAWTGLHQGRVIGAAGIVLPWPGRAVTWCLLGAAIPPLAWTGIHRAVRSRLAQLPALGVRRVEAETAAGWPPGERWMVMLGFEPEGVARAYGPDGRDFIRWSRIWQS